jgi:hypothetical protein
LTVAPGGVCLLKAARPRVPRLVHSFIRAGAFGRRNGQKALASARETGVESTMSKSPAFTVKEKFGDKAKLVAAMASFTQGDLWVARLNEKKGLARVSNAKLLRLFSVLSEVKAKFGSRAKLIEAICELEKRTKDDGYKKRLGGYPVPRLYDLYRAVGRRKGLKGLGPRELKIEAPPPEAASAPKPAAKEKKAAPKAAAEAPAPRAKKASAAPAAAKEPKAAPKRKAASEKKDEAKPAKKSAK